MKQTFNFLTLSRVFNDCRDSVGRLSTLFLLLFALSFGFSSQAWGANQHYNMKEIYMPNNLNSWATKDVNYKLDYVDGNQFKKEKLYLPANTDFEFKIYAVGDDWEEWWGTNSGVTINTSGNYDKWDWWKDYNCANLTIHTQNATSGYVAVNVEFWGNYSNNSVFMHKSETAVSPLSGNMYPTTSTVSSGSSLNMAPTLTGGSGSYNKQYSASPDIGSFDGDNYKAPMVFTNTTVTISLEVSDANGQLSGLAHKTITKQITITPPTGDLYIKHAWGDGQQGSWSWQKMEKVSNGNYRFSGNYGGTGCNINTTNNDEGAKYIDNTSGLVVQNTPALDDKCWFTLSYSDGKLTVAPKTYTLTLDNKGGSTEPSSLIVTYGKACPTFTAPTKTGYTYVGYNKSGTNTKVINQNGTFVASGTYTQNNNWHYDNTIGLDAIWKANSIKITFKKNGATSGTDSQTQTMTYDLAGNLKTIQELGYTRTGYDFAGWALTAGGEVEYEDGEEVTNLSTGDGVTLFAKWTAHTTTITLNRNYTDGGTHNITVSYDSEFDATLFDNADINRTGYTFNGYKANTSGSSADIIKVNEGVYSFPNSGSYGSDGKWKYDERTLTAYAYWTANPYTITLHYNNGTDNTENKSVTFDAAPTSVTKPTYGTNVFNGYFTQATGGVQVINADGAFVPNVDGYTSNGNWVKASDVDLYAQWTTRTACTITYGVTDGTLAVSTRGTIKAKIGDGSYTNTGSLAVYTGDVVTIEYSPKSGQYYTSNNGYEANGWYSAVSGGSSLPATHKNDYTFTVTGNASVYVKADPVVYTISTAVAPASTTVYPEGTGTVTPTSGEAGPDIALQLTAAEQIGYDWVNWTLSDETNGKIVTGTETDKTISVAAKAAGFTATANFTAHEYTITYHPNNGGADISEQYTIETAHTLATNPGRTDYTFDGWFDNAGFTGSAVTEIPQGTTGDKVYWAKWHETTYPVTIQTSTGIQSVTPSGEQQVGNVNPIEISATVATGYTWNLWTSSDANVTITEASSINTSIKATGTGTVTATATENKVTLTPTVNDVNMGTVSTGGLVGIATGLTMTATKENGYKFDHWELSSNLIIQDSKTNTDNPITVKTNGDGEAVTAQAVFVEDLSTGVYLQSNGITPQQWQDLEAYEFKKISGHSTSNDVYLTITTTEDEQYKYVDGGTDNNQFILHDTHGADNKHILSKTDGYWFVNSYAINTTLSSFVNSGYKNMRFFSTVPGTYTFHYNLSTRAFDITYPDQYSIQICNAGGQWTAHNFVDNSVNINLAADNSIRFRVVYQGAYYGNTGTMTKDNCSGWTMTNNSEVRKECWINTAKAGGYIFTFDTGTKKLTVTYPEETFQTVTVYKDGVTPEEVKVYEVTKPSITAQVPEGMNFNGWVTTGGATVDNASSTTTTVTNAGTNGTVKATFNTNQYIYFKDGVNGKFGNVWVTFRKSDYWDNSKGSGNNELSYAALGMTKISNTDIHYFHIDDAHKDWDEVKWGIVQFTNSGIVQQNFYLTKVAYPHHNNDKSTYSAALPLFVPRDWIYDINSSQYYNDGIWMKYNSTESGYDIRGDWDSWAANTHKFVAETPGGYEFKTTIHLAAGTTYKFRIYNDNNREYSISGTMTATSCSNWHMYMNQGDCQITATEAGDYIFTLNLGSGEVLLSVEYPLSASDYHVVAKQGDVIKWEGDLIKHSNEAKKDTTSFFNNNYTFQLQQYNGTKWNDVAGQSIASATLPESVRTQSIINFIVEQDGNNHATLTYEGVYKGNFYIRTDGVDGGWGDYKNNSDNKMDNYGSLIDADPTYQYDVYKAKWVPSGKNVKFRVANDYSKAISDEFTTDDIIDNKETLPEGANVRFMWNSTTNELKRAYIGGSTDDEKRYLMLINTNHLMYDKTGETQIDELKFADNNNWVYQADIQAQPGCEVKLTAQYNSKVQYFIGSASDARKIIDGSGDTKYTLRAVYDFKTNRLVAGWIPSGTIEKNIELGSDMLIERIEQGDASQIVFGGAEPSSLSISEIQHIYGVLKLTKATMVGATETDYAKCIYWISFPFDVKVSEIFGVEKYGEVWAITKYNGEKRAEKGWFKQDTQTFWEFLKPSDIMKANVGYTLNLDPDYFNKESSEPWKNSATEVAWYFPSIEENVGVVSLAQKDTTLAAQHCTIDREFNAGTDDNPRMVNHKFTDSNWRVIGVPAFQNLQAPNFNPAPAGDDTEFGLKGFYEWDPEYNTYTAQTASGYTFHATHSYMVQYEGKITWSNAAVITTNKAPWHAPEYTYADAKNYSITLEFGNDAYTDQTFVTLIEKASTDFVLNEDMMKIDNAGFPNIYSFAGAYDVAYNETTFDNQTVMLGVSAPKNGSYTFAMPKDFSGKAVLVDLESGEATDLNLSNYTVELNKGTYNNRFQLMLEVEAKTPTNIQNANGEWNADGKTKKLLINDQIYLINAGRIYNATGTKVK